MNKELLKGALIGVVVGFVVAKVFAKNKFSNALGRVYEPSSGGGYKMGGVSYGAASVVSNASGGCGCSGVDGETSTSGGTRTPEQRMTAYRRFKNPEMEFIDGSVVQDAIM